MFKVVRNQQALAFVFALTFAFCLSARVTAQQSDSATGVPPQSGDQSQSRERGQDAGIPSDPAIEFLRTHPDLLATAKQFIAERATAAGEQVSAADVSDAALYARMEQDSVARAKLVEWLRQHGYEEGRNNDTVANATLGYADEASAMSSNGRHEPPRTGEGAYEPGARFRVTNRRTSEWTNEPGYRRANEDPNAARIIRQSSPYPDLPSVRDLYSQIPSQTAPLQRFGIDIFRNGTGNADTVPIDLPAGPDYVLGPGDGLNIDIWGGVSQRISRTVDREGRIALPEAGTVTLAGLTLAQAQQLIQKVLTPQFRNVQIDVSLTRVRSVRVYVVGDVDRPGAYDISSLSTPLNALYAAGGPTPRGSLRTVQHYRGDKLVRTVDLYDFLLHGVRSGVERLQPGDTILVPPVGPQVAVAGLVRRPAIYEVRNEKNLSDVLALAGGVLVSATLRQVRVERIEAHEQRTMLSLNLPDGSDHQARQKALDSFQVQDGDRVMIDPILPYSNETVYLEGHVFRPGKYPYHPGMTVADLIHSYDDLLPEPATRAEVIRLVPPDFHPEAQEFDLREVLSGDDPIELKPFDTLRILGRYEADPPKVAIYGQVLRPGVYPLSHDMTAAALVRLAGGLTRSAYTQTADLATYVVQNGNRILTEHQEIAIGKALAGDKSVDVVLQPHDVVTIRQLSGWADLGASVTLNGDVMYPGKYGIQDGEKLSSLIQRAGGFRPTAYPEGAALERVQVRELAEKSRTEMIRQIQTNAFSTNFAASSGQEQAATMQAMTQQRDQVLNTLRSQPATGRLVVNLSSDITRWQNTPDDIQLRAGDVLTVPKRPNFVLINGQVYNPSAITYRPGNNAEWYLKRAGGPTELANRKAIFIIRANGSVVSGNEGWFGSGVLGTRMMPGDTIVVPDKIVGGSSLWKNLLSTAQLTSSLAIAARVATSF